ncbi:Hypothetical Protein FCC1311_022652 [Hondaea fermentalgiana]|uniref:SH3 domain-containing protein n=1 Tax=Hondaea fermentalgiana TaxID=2315210 RepID=A0A2R5G686_9STRA|nr:Hypothetical Protein FCC1311_022652 [Hondaea fermentalgiana]|eukprot:GBG26045.1 Hypothetical Protein FCC1311_022652 [Hondaea fermentalgiana]
MAPLYKVRYTFRAEDEGELAVSKGDLVKLVIPSRLSAAADEVTAEEVSKDGWTLVETLAQPVRKGYVPTNYIVRSEENAATARESPSRNERNTLSAARPRTAGSDRGENLTSRMGSPRESSPTESSRVGPIRRLSDPRLPQHLLETLEASDATIDLGAAAGRYGSQHAAGMQPQAAPSPAPAAPRNASSYEPQYQQPHQLQPYQPPPTDAGTGAGVDLTQLFADHDAWHDKVIREREDEFAAFENSLDHVSSALGQVQEKNQNVISKVLSVEAQVEALKNQLKQQIQADRKSLSERFSSPYESQNGDGIAGF